MTKLGALWEKKDKNGRTYFSGKFEDTHILVFSNKKDKDSQPDYVIYKAEPRGGELK